MNNLNNVKRLFVKQCGRNDCGSSCISMILNYAGKTDEADRISSEGGNLDEGLSLLKLREMAQSFGFKARCVSMDFPALKSCLSPCILHTVSSEDEGHFLVCFGSSDNKGNVEYLIGDPAQGVRYFTEKDLDSIWPGRAALYFEYISYVKPTLHQHPLLLLFRLSSFRKTLLITIPFLNLCITVLGIALSWTLQRGMKDSLADKKMHIIIAVILLLFLITICKSLINVVKQKILITLNSAISEELTTIFIHKIIDDDLRRQVNARKAMAEIRKIQNAVSSAVAVVVSEGSLVIFIVGATAWFVPLAACINAAYIIAACLMGVFKSRQLALSGDRLNELAGYNEKSIEAEWPILVVGDLSGIKYRHLENHRSYLAFARELALQVSQQNFVYECTGTVSVILVFITGLKSVNDLQISYTSLMVVVILSYFIATVMVRICSSFPVILDGASLIRRYRGFR
jgi:ABC-type bacteriocin/lantibiotic exporter with double-glycine peptidase domain